MITKLVHRIPDEETVACTIVLLRKQAFRKDITMLTQNFTLQLGTAPHLPTQRTLDKD
jgi:hypothetical protein